MSDHTSTAPFEQHFLTETQAYERLLPTLGLTGRSVAEFGAGRGELTRLLVKAGARVVAYEIDAGLSFDAGYPPDASLPIRASGGGVELRIEDVAKADLSFLGPEWACASNPPYSILDLVLSALDAHGVRDALLMVPAKRVPDLIQQGFKTAFELGGDAFHPPARGRHIVMIRGFRT